MTAHSLIGAREHQAVLCDAAPGRLALAKRATVIIARIIGNLLWSWPVFLATRVTRGRSAARQGFCYRSVRLLQTLGPTFIKCGQIFSTRRDELPDDLCDALALLQDRVAPLPKEVALAEMTACYGAPLIDTFSDIDLTPIASGSIASVYRARTLAGKTVAVKLRRPGIERVMAADLALARGAAALLSRLPLFRNVPVVPVVEDMCMAIELQLDFAREADCLVRVARAVAPVARVWVPRPVAALCQPNVLVMDYISDLARDTADSLHVAIRNQLAETTLSAAYTMLFVDGFVHCDMHPGNLYFRKSGQVVILDAGFSVQMSNRMRSLFAEFFLEMAWGRSHRCAEIVLESAIVRSPEATTEQFLVEMAELAYRNHNLPAKAFSLIAFASKMFELHRRHGLRAAPELVFPLLTLLVIEGIVRALDPEIDFQEVAKPILTRAIFCDTESPEGRA